MGRFTTKEPIGLCGGLNLYQYAPNPLGGGDPLDLTSCALANGMEKAGTLRPANSAAHHIVPEIEKGDRPARDILRRHDIDINGVENGVFLPNRNNTGDLPWTWL